MLAGKVVALFSSQGNVTKQFTTSICIILTKSGRQNVMNFLAASLESSMKDLFLRPRKSYLAVVAIDFGTTYSGFAFAFNQKGGEGGIHMNKDWGNDQGCSTPKTPTCLLLNPDGEFHSFGYEAKENYAALEEDEVEQYYYFERFKMTLHESTVLLCLNVTLKSDCWPTKTTTTTTTTTTNIYFHFRCELQ